jgi:hypothetical protein
MADNNLCLHALRKLETLRYPNQTPLPAVGSAGNTGGVETMRAAAYLAQFAVFFEK